MTVQGTVRTATGSVATERIPLSPPNKKDSPNGGSFLFLKFKANSTISVVFSPSLCYNFHRSAKRRSGDAAAMSECAAE